MLNPDVRRVLDGTSIAHLATILPDGSPADNPFNPITVRGRVVEWIEGDAAWEIVDRVATKYTGMPHSREHERVVAVIEPERQTVGVA